MAADDGKPARQPISTTQSADQLLQQLQFIQASLKADMRWRACLDKGRLLINPLVSDDKILVVDPLDTFPGSEELGDDLRPAVVMTQGCYDRSVAILMEGTTDTKDDVTRDLVAYFIWLGVQEGLVL